MPSGFYTWSQTASSNATADSAIGWSEGQAPSSINDSARALMSVLAKYRDDISGIVTGGSSTAFTVTSNSGFGSLTALNGQLIAIVPNATSTNAVGVDVTLSVDGLTGKPIRMQPGVALPSGTLVSGTPYLCVYNNADGAFYLQNTTNPYCIPLGGSIEFWGTTAPNSSFVFPFGQAISRTTYSTLFSMFSTTYGAGDGTTTFNVPDLRGRVVAGKDDMGGSAASRLSSTYFGGTATSLGAVGGGESETLTAAQLPSITSTGSFTSTQGAAVISADTNVTNFSTGTGGSTGWLAWAVGTTVLRGSITGSLSVTSSGTSGNPHNIVQPTITSNFILRVI